MLAWKFRELFIISIVKPASHTSLMTYVCPLFYNVTNRKRTNTENYSYPRKDYQFLLRRYDWFQMSSLPGQLNFGLATRTLTRSVSIKYFQIIWIHPNTFQYIHIHFCTSKYFLIHLNTSWYIQIHLDTSRYIQIHLDPFQIWRWPSKVSRVKARPQLLFASFV